MSENGLTAALQVEYEAVYAYSSAVVHLSGSLREVAEAAEQGHRELRDAVIMALSDTDRPVPAAASAYRLVADAEDHDTAVAVISAVEDKAAQTWRAAISTHDRDDRRLAVEGLSTVAASGAAWRRGIGESPSVPPFPGRP